MRVCVCVYRCGNVCVRVYIGVLMRERVYLVCECVKVY